VRIGVKPTVSSLVKPSHALKDRLIERTLEVWVPRFGRELTREDARQIAEDMVGFFEILNEWCIGEATSSVGHTPKCDRHESSICTDHSSMTRTVQEGTTGRANS
jgi:hypothetical protein